MKLYTQEQVKEIYFKGVHNGRLHIEGKCSDEIESLTPIEIPSDEEIQKESKFKSNHNNPQAVQFNPALNIVWVEGAKWMRDKIQGGNK
jgi:hypothetical protein